METEVIEEEECEGNLRMIGGGYKKQQPNGVQVRRK